MVLLKFPHEEGNSILIRMKHLKCKNVGFTHSKSCSVCHILDIVGQFCIGMKLNSQETFSCIENCIYSMY